jgi:hypothetical protein
MKENLTILFLAAVCGLSPAHAQPPPPPPPVQGSGFAASGSLSGSITQFNYGQDGRVEGFVLAPNTLVLLPPEWAQQFESLAKRGDSVKVTGVASLLASGMQVMDAQAVTVGGRTLSFVEPGQPVPYTGSGSIRQLNYGRGGEVNGFVLANGIIATTPPFGASDLSAIKPGVNISISGFAHTTPTGTTVVNVQSVTINGQTLALAGAGPESPPPPPPGPGRGGRGGRGGPPPPPPPPPGR